MDNATDRLEDLMCDLRYIAAEVRDMSKDICGVEKAAELAELAATELSDALDGRSAVRELRQ